jgi:BirA family biotin operon repressor/biotin-[acetyl-CoA-carboxylase] ligase
MTLPFEPLIAEKILNTIDPVNLLKLAKLEILECIDSTNQHLLDYAKEGPSGWVCLAEQQTAGRGRRGREWVSASGSSILCSLLWRFPKELSDVSSLSIAVGVMLARALKKYGVSAGIQLKWPNDVLYANRKLAGILLERRAENIVIGFGLNVNLPKPVVGGVDLAEITGRFVASRNDLAGLIINELLEGLTIYQAKGLAAFMDEWRQCDFLAGKEVTVQMPEKIILGTAMGINENGELLILDETQTIQCFCYGEVTVRERFSLTQS